MKRKTFKDSPLFMIINKSPGWQINTNLYNL